MENNLTNNELYETMERVINHPLKREDIVDAVLCAWKKITRTNIDGFQFGDFTPSPQLLGELLHSVIPLEIMSRFPDEWRAEASKYDKDIVFISNDIFSIELTLPTAKAGGFLFQRIQPL